MKILVMRPSSEGEKLVKMLNYIKIPSWHFPLFDFLPSTSSVSLSKQIHKLYTSDIILIFSKKAVYYTNLYLNQNNLCWPLFPNYYAVGRSTAIALKKYVKKKFYFLKLKKIVKLY